ncbi:RecX family transcriptional regulator [Luoshenia tenuis]|jgi:regulatory protein|uniref:RecX family transcriptional regulator n=1 Tax=Luoshenia tenuis TaxID=2763654 RepID=UPI003D8B1564
MALVTAIEDQKRNRTRVNIYLDGEYAFSLEKETCARLHIAMGMKIEPEQVAQAAVQDERRVAFDRALSYLERRARTEKQVRDYLRAREFAQDVIDDTLQKLKGYRFVDDAAYAKNFAQGKLNAAGQGPHRIRRALKMQGVPDAVAERAVSELDEERQAQLLAAQAEKVLRRYAALPRREAMGKAGQALYRKGFGWDEIASALREAYEALELDKDEDEDF